MSKIIEYSTALSAGSKTTIRVIRFQSIPGHPTSRVVWNMQNLFVILHAAWLPPLQLALVLEHLAGTQTPVNQGFSPAALHIPRIVDDGSSNLCHACMSTFIKENTSRNFRSDMVPLPPELYRLVIGDHWPQDVLSNEGNVKADRA
ncbi:hypothetical protein PSTG_18709 [Puccinia striiformis f. sp. tritici PST-78]|uniref:Uncharacterized protein n=1 Tax=Puccinia striiformis f. sp. tritici PST-78 TaxID=1165861 RepID=A0A0L0ULD5_9BASI|nr:hypothetical protein PSTG_18709 [Puccinia striiformis f. sp. tritici PST-78]